MLSLRGSSRSSAILKPLLAFQRKPVLISPRNLSRGSPRRNLCFSLKPSDRNGLASASSTSETYVLDDTPMSGMEDVLVSYIFGKKRATEVAHSVWKHVVKKGDTVIDATCGNGYDTLALLKMVSDELGRGCVYAMDVQKDALVNTNTLLEESVNANERDLVKLLPICHSELDKVIPEKASVRISRRGRRLVRGMKLVVYITLMLKSHLLELSQPHHLLLNGIVALDTHPFLF
ncbi:uncharacterized protein LOC122281370 isoform X2 [Carya illinoinensis]|uniref:uncharacterized protein LOC122281370 isoform X2 n=1 Tax=Carya illinoinensis TaxID=32201 RepID=UPI001C72677F|nr:uncharacterized protein LOC122281370 isoform X2 [Carya illinoinensis]